jgi:hypothetical protein
MSDLRTAAQQALEALEFMADEWGFTQKANRPERWQAIDALRAALEQPNRAQRQRDAGYTRRPTLREMADPEQPEQEPVAWMTPRKDIITCNGAGTRFSDWTPLYTHPPRREWRGLTEEDIWTLAANSLDSVLGRLHFARAIEAALKERNA